MALNKLCLHEISSNDNLEKNLLRKKIFKVLSPNSCEKRIKYQFMLYLLEKHDFILISLDCLKIDMHKFRVLIMFHIVKCI